MTKYKCPNCGSTQFEAPATERVTWIIDEYGEFVKVGYFLDVIDRPSEDDLWTCTNCYYKGLGSDFIVEEQNIEN